jgi:hypothetical protein
MAWRDCEFDQSAHGTYTPNSHLLRSNFLLQLFFSCGICTSTILHFDRNSLIYDIVNTRWQPRVESESGNRRLISTAKLLWMGASKVRLEPHSQTATSMRRYQHTISTHRNLPLDLHPSQALADPDLLPQSLVLHLPNRSHSLLLAPARIPLQSLVCRCFRQHGQRVHVEGLEFDLRDGGRAGRRSCAADQRLQP